MKSIAKHSCDGTVRKYTSHIDQVDIRSPDLNLIGDPGPMASARLQPRCCGSKQLRPINALRFLQKVLGIAQDGEGWKQ